MQITSLLHLVFPTLTCSLAMCAISFGILSGDLDCIPSSSLSFQGGTGREPKTDPLKNGLRPGTIAAVTPASRNTGFNEILPCGLHVLKAATSKTHHRR